MFTCCSSRTSFRVLLDPLPACWPRDVDVVLLFPLSALQLHSTFLSCGPFVCLFLCLRLKCRPTGTSIREKSFFPTHSASANQVPYSIGHVLLGPALWRSRLSSLSCSLSVILSLKLNNYLIKHGGITALETDRNPCPHAASATV